MGLTFEWNDVKARSNLDKHGVSFQEATTIFADSKSFTIPDPLHSKLEKRHVILGCSYRDRLLVVVHTERGNNIRIISARLASRRERKQYEENN